MVWQAAARHVQGEPGGMRGGRGGLQSLAWHPYNNKEDARREALRGFAAHGPAVAGAAARNFGPRRQHEQSIRTVNNP